jgi:hypothetical protein
LRDFCPPIANNKRVLCEQEVRNFNPDYSREAPTIISSISNVQSLMEPVII